MRQLDSAISSDAVVANAMDIQRFGPSSRIGIVFAARQVIHRLYSN
jgi:hypothetical protein